ncbi:hypothetical protein PTKIN_Ptkin13bG0280000 [Pterospermum kingtungense]
MSNLELDEAAVVEFKSKWDGKDYDNVGDYDLIVVGKGRFPSSVVAKLVDLQAEHAELEPIGDLSASSGHRVLSSVLVIQQHDTAHAERF